MICPSNQKCTSLTGEILFSNLYVLLKSTSDPGCTGWSECGVGSTLSHGVSSVVGAGLQCGRIVLVFFSERRSPNRDLWPCSVCGAGVQWRLSNAPYLGVTKPISFHSQYDVSSSWTKTRLFLRSVHASRTVLEQRCSPHDHTRNHVFSPPCGARMPLWSPLTHRQDHQPAMVLIPQTTLQIKTSGTICGTIPSE